MKAWIVAAALLAAPAAAFGQQLPTKKQPAQPAKPSPLATVNGIAVPQARLNWSWVGFFAFMGVLNLYVAFNYSEKVWASFKLFGGIGLMLLFVLAQSALLAKYVEDKP